MPEQSEETSRLGVDDDQARAQLVQDIEHHASLPADVTANVAIAAVMCTLVERLTAGEAHNLAQALPPSVRGLFERCVVHRQLPVAKLDHTEFLHRIAEHLGVTPAHAEAVCRAVFAAIRARLTPEQVDGVTHQLPRGLNELWLAPPGPAWLETSASAGQARQDVIAEIEEQVARPPGVTGADIFAAVMCILSRRLSGGEARHVLLALPATLRPLVSQCALHRGEHAPAFGRDEFSSGLGDHLGTSSDEAEYITRVVFAAVRSVLPEKDFQDVASQLPPDLRSLWMSREADIADCAPSSSEPVATITRDELVDAMNRGAPQVVNVLEQPPFGRLRLVRGSKHIPLSALEQRVNELDRHREVIVYCANYACEASRTAAAWLERKGFRVRAYEGGIQDWVAGGLPTEITEHA